MLYLSAQCNTKVRPCYVERSYGRARVERFLAIKARLDPDWILTSDLWRRIGLGR